MDQDKHQQKQYMKSSKHSFKGSSVVSLTPVILLVLVLYLLYLYFVTIPIYKHASRTGNGWATFFAGMGFPLQFAAYRYPAIIK